MTAGASVSARTALVGALSIAVGVAIAAANEAFLLDGDIRGSVDGAAFALAWLSVRRVRRRQ